MVDLVSKDLGRPNPVAWLLVVVLLIVAVVIAVVFCRGSDAGGCGCSDAGVIIFAVGDGGCGCGGVSVGIVRC